jgi:hypothetical protein
LFGLFLGSAQARLVEKGLHGNRSGLEKRRRRMVVNENAI